MTGAGALRETVAFDAPDGATDAFGGTSVGWRQELTRKAQIIYQSGGEAVQAARLAGRATFKVKLRQSAAVRQITTDWRMRHVNRGAPDGVSGDALPGHRYDIVEVDSITDRAWVWIVVQGQVIA